MSSELVIGPGPGRILLSHTRTDLTQECTRTLLHIPRFVLCYKILDFVRYLPAASNTGRTLVGIPRHFNLDYHRSQHVTTVPTLHQTL